MTTLKINLSGLIRRKNMKKKKFCRTILMLVPFLFFTLPGVHAAPAGEPAIIEIQPAILSVNVIGDREKFEEDHWVSRNTSGGIEKLNFSKQLNKQDSLEFDGRAILGNHDFNSNLTLAREGVGSLTVAFNEFRKYYDGTGGFYSGFANYIPRELDNDLHLDVGKFKFAGILAKENSPEYSLSYERDFRDGSKSLLRWMSVRETSASSTVSNRKINPAYLETAETIDRLKFGIKHETNDTLASGEQLWEHTRVKNKDLYSQTYTIATSTFGAPSIQYWNMDSDRYSTTFHYAKDLNEKVSLACGLLYNNYLGGSIENLDSSTVLDNPASIEQNSVTLLPNISFTPFKDLLLGIGSKAEFINKNGGSTYDTLTRKINIKSETYNKIFTQNLELKYNGMKNVAWFADGEFEKRFITQFEEQNSYSVGTSTENFSRQTDTATNLTNFSVGCKWYPMSKLSVTLKGKNKNGFTDNKHELLTGDITTPGGTSPGTYRGFIDTMTYNTRTPSVKMRYKPFRWITTNLGYTYDSTIYGVRTRASDQTMKSKYYAHIYNTEVTFTPYEYFYLSLFYERRNSSTKTFADSYTSSTVSIPLYNSDVDVYRLNYGYALTKNTSLDGGFSMYNTANFNEITPGLPLGLDNTGQDLFIGCKHTFDKDRSLEFKYTFSKYDEDSNNNFDDYEAHLFSAAMNMKF